ncbi:NYN domain-containing protein [Thermomonas sp.]|uniref:NYN domain-containing protein n=1 Tax=Thermomonas sp. TaxID=1971895 RepID=UPI002488468C|nr:NYN domain-containing protein [Thermomonas sp.]MDI1252771.1 NYN domain-containing protein [Thermomonas sp.]
MLTEPALKRAVVFIDGQNLYHAARIGFGYTHPNFDVLALSTAVCIQRGWQLEETRFYTGVPELRDNAFWHRYWSGKMRDMRHKKIVVFSRPLRYRNQTVKLPDGSSHTVRAGEEKGIDVRIAIDIIRLAHHGRYDVAIVFSQDQDLSEAADEVRHIAQEQQRWIKVASAYPQSPTSHNRRGINGTDWIPIDRATYDAALDPKDYR